MIFREGGGRDIQISPNLRGHPYSAKLKGGGTPRFGIMVERGAYSDLAVAKSNIFHAHQ